MKKTNFLGRFFRATLQKYFFANPGDPDRYAFGSRTSTHRAADPEEPAAQNPQEVPFIPGPSPKPPHASGRVKQCPPIIAISSNRIGSQA
jgi:hypothetical protein